MLQWVVSAGIVLAGAVPPLAAQTFEAVGTRAAGMGGAFVAVADDASAAYWNPAGFASGSVFSLVIDRSRAELDPPGTGSAGSRSGFLMALGTPAVALSYYRLRSLAVNPLAGLAGTDAVQADTLVTHHVGATVVHSLVPGVAVGATLKLVRGIASSSVRPASERNSLLHGDGDMSGEGRTRFDADLGVMAGLGRVRAGLTLRNLTEPSFGSPGQSVPVKLQRQARAGLAVAPVGGWILAADVDILRPERAAGPARRFAVGTEGRVHRKAFVRGGISANATGDRSPSVSAGASFAATGSLLIDAEVTGGSDTAARGWGVSARLGY
jgi:hypothetical protein